MAIVERLASVQAEIAAACARVGRLPESVTLVAVSKTHPPAVIIEAARAGVRHFGENRIEEAGKIAQVDAEFPGLTWHMIGHVQSRKAREVVQHYAWIHSLDSLKLAERYARFAQESSRTVQVLLDMTVSGEPGKEGFAVSDWQNDPTQRESLWNAIRRMIELPGLHIRGLMTMAPIVAQAEQARPVFAGLRRLRDALAADFPGAEWVELSMGMTDDYRVAIEEGATLVRIGRAIFGERQLLQKESST